MTAADREVIPHSWAPWMFKSLSVATLQSELELCKDGEVGLRVMSRLVECHIGVDEDDDAITSCVIEAVECASRGHKSRPSPKSAQTALRALRKAIDAVGEGAPMSNGIPAGACVVKVETWKRYCCQSGISDSDEPEAQKKAFSRAHKTLVDGNHVQAHHEYRWISE
jgi:hypothetical protein